MSARDLTWYWAAGDLGISMVDLALRLDLTPAAINIAIQRGEKLAKEIEYHLEA